MAVGRSRRSYLTRSFGFPHGEQRLEKVASLVDFRAQIVWGDSSSERGGRQQETDRQELCEHADSTIVSFCQFRIYWLIGVGKDSRIA